MDNQKDIRLDPSTMGFSPFEIRLLYCNFTVDRPTGADTGLSDPFWRFYWNRTPGAAVQLDRTVTELVPSNAVLVAPYTPFNKLIRRPADHFHMHFIAGPAFESVRGRIFSMPAETGIRSALKEILALLEKRDTASLRFLALTGHVIAWALCGLPAELLRSVSGDARVQKACLRMDRACGETNSTRELAREAGMNLNAFIRLFKSKAGMTPQQYLAKRRMERACELLHFSNQSIDRIALETGFCDRNHFSRKFAVVTGIGPAKYRRSVV